MTAPNGGFTLSCEAKAGVFYNIVRYPMLFPSCIQQVFASLSVLSRCWDVAARIALLIALGGGRGGEPEEHSPRYLAC